MYTSTCVFNGFRGAVQAVHYLIDCLYFGGAYEVQTSNPLQAPVLMGLVYMY